MKQFFKILLMIVTPLSMMIGCGEDREHKPLSKIEVMSKSLIDTDADYLFVASTGEVSRTTSVGLPYFQGQETIVRLAFEEKDLVAYEVDRETQFQGNETNRKVVFKIPIEHLEFRERTDAFGEGTNIEENNDFVEYQDRQYFKARPEEFKFTAVSTLPTELENLWGGSGCLDKQGQSELEFKVDKTGVDIVVRRDFTSRIYCESFNELNDLAWSQETHYSLVPLDSVISKDYKTKEYSRDWERTFGFFDRTERSLDSSNNETQFKEKYIMHRWNPDRESITYHLDPRLNKPENYILKQATLKGFERLNAALEESGAKIRLKTVDGGEDFKPGDIKYSSIVIVEDPVKAGLLGYGPSVTNPLTGEIVQARTVMYPGIMKKLIRRAYDELIEIDETLQEQPTQNLSGLDELKRMLIAPAFETETWKNVGTELPNPPPAAGSSEEASDALIAPSTQGIAKTIAFEANQFFERSKRSLLQLYYEASDAKEDSFDAELARLDLIDFYSRNNMMPAMPEAFSDLTDTVLKDKILAIGQKQPWDDLTEESRTLIVNLAMPYVWIPTLIHEVGHNLGLRHNFEGSEDEDNFYTIEELAEKGVTSDLGSPYSSMMEYSKSEITGLRVPGKYDVAALRYGYADKVELIDGSLVSALGEKPVDTKPYGYCSDEGVSLNPNCNRFDEGTNLVEIMESMIDSYYKRYQMSYFRNERVNFSRYEDLGAAARTASTFRSMRLAFERLSDIMIENNLGIEEVKGIEWLNDYNEASKVAAEFLMSVAAEPDYSCIVYREGEFNAVMTFKELQQLTFAFDAKNCTDLQASLNGPFTIEGEFGRSFLSRRFSDNPNIYLDQIDVRGVWFDKILATKYLMRRELKMFSFDDNTVSYADHPEIGADVVNFFKNMALGKVRSNVEVTLNDGSKFMTDYDHNFVDGYDMPKPLRSYLNTYLGLPTEKQSFVPAVLRVVRQSAAEGLQTSSSNENFEGFVVRKQVPLNASQRDYTSYTVLGETYVLSRRNDLAARIIDKVELINNVYSKLSREELIVIFEALRTGEPPAREPSEDELKVVQGGIQNLYDYLTGVLPSQEYYYGVLEVM